MTPEQTFVVDQKDVEAKDFEWGSIKWLCNSSLASAAEQTFGLLYINPGQKNRVHVHSNCEEILYVMSGECDHGLGDEVYHLEPGMMIRVPSGVKHDAVNDGWEPMKAVVCYSSAEREMEVVE